VSRRAPIGTRVANPDTDQAVVECGARVDFFAMREKLLNRTTLDVLLVVLVVLWVFQPTLV
jgi:hypothetical protein